MERAGRTRTAARQALQDELRRARGERTEVLRPESRFRDAAHLWMAKIHERRADSTADTYAMREGRLTPVAPPSENGAGAGRAVTYHDPCYIGRHNGVYDPPRELIGALPGVTLTEMPRHGNRSFCCGAGGARMWMEEKLGTRINGNRMDEALATGAEQVAVACPFCRVMLGDSLTSKQAEGTAGENVEVVDVAQMLLAAVRRGPASDDAASVPAPA
jgi:hypothetical protein